MKRILSTLLAGAAVLPIMTVMQFEALTGLSSAWERPENRKLIEERLRINHTDKYANQFFEARYKANVREVGEYSRQYLCMSKKNTKVCRVGAAW